GLKQSLVAQNMANSDTPGYAAKTLPDFAATLQGNGLGSNLGSHLGSGRSFALRASRDGHLGAEARALTAQIETVDASADPNGNSVTLETELLNSVDAKRQHDRALAIYKSGMNILRATIGRS
ncbi:MAG: flagellar basal body rod protein FlgB, partial [Primorskyibacter sp.]